MEAIKKELKEILHFIEWQIDNGRCTADQMQSIADAMKRELRVDASIDEIAQFYGQSESNVRNVITRRMVEKPKRRILYNFLSFIRITPKGW